MKSKLFNEIQIKQENTVLTGQPIFDNWFSADGGIVPGSIIFVTGTSGAGKTTLMVNLMNWLKNHVSALYSREMSISSLKHQMKNYAFNNNNAHFADDNDFQTLNEYFKELERIKPEFLIIDSLQAIAIQDYKEIGEEKAAVHVRELLTKWCHKNNCTLFLIGHNTKDNEFAGKNTNMQMVDAHMVLEYDPKTNTRKMYWGKKNRKGPMGEIQYTIENGSILFIEEKYEINFIEEFNSFLNNYLSNFDSSHPDYIQLKSELNKISKNLLKKHQGDEYFYMTDFMPEVYHKLYELGYN